MSEKWDERFMRMAAEVASWSKDQSRKVGCVVVNRSRVVVATGYNGFPRGVNDDAPERHERPAKYLFMEHAERNAVFAAARLGVRLEGCTIYVPWFPCADCARAIIQAGISEMVAYEPDMSDERWRDGFVAAIEMLREAGVSVRHVPGVPPKAS